MESLLNYGSEDEMEHPMNESRRCKERKSSSFQEKHDRDRRRDNEERAQHRESGKWSRDDRDDRYKRSDRTNNDKNNRNQTDRNYSRKFSDRPSHSGSRREYETSGDSHRSSRKSDRDHEKRGESSRRAENENHRNFKQSSRYRERRSHSRSKSPRQRRHQEKSPERDNKLKYEKKSSEIGVESMETNAPSEKTMNSTIETNLMSSSAPRECPQTSTAETSQLNSVQIPKYYNPSTVNPNKYAEQALKRKLLWSGKKAEENASIWGTAQFSEDSDGKVASKFMRLMGIKNLKSSESSTTAEKGEGSGAKTREAMFSTMEQQYEVARQTTHTMRGMGFGFTSSLSRPT